MATVAASEDKERGIRLQGMLRPIKELQYYDMKVPEGERFVELGECLGHRPFLKSHVFQSVVLALYSLRCSEHPDIAEDNIWSKEDVPTVVANVMIIVKQFLDGSVDEATDEKRSRFWSFPQLSLESEGHCYNLHQPESLCFDVYRGETIKQHFARMWHVLQQFAIKEEADDNFCKPFVDFSAQHEKGSETGISDNVVSLLPLNFAETEV